MRKLLLIAVAALAWFGACGDDDGGGGDATDTGTGTAADSGDEPGEDEVVVGVRGLRFEPEEVTIKVGGTVRWKWDENIAHNVKSKSDEEFATDGNVTEADLTHTFDDAGTYNYTCDIHPGMDGTVEVEE